MVRKDGSNKRH